MKVQGKISDNEIKVLINLTLIYVGEWMVGNFTESHPPPPPSLFVCWFSLKTQQLWNLYAL